MADQVGKEAVHLPPEASLGCIVLAAVLAVANAGYLGGPAVSYGAPALSYGAPAYASAAYAPAAITSQHSNILRTPVSNDALAYGAVPAYSSYAAPAYHGAYAAPAIHGAYAAPAIHGAYGSPVVRTGATTLSGHGLLGVAYSAAPVVSHMTYSNAYGLHYAY
uniref:Uncharacterized protein n=1 Tax=Timema douglasi TaxID=61478 RepID=A0A7R8VZX4_TIMDO|nr:unnamed protein product [Timema douglasi]